MATKVYVGNLSSKSTEDSLRTMFTEFGEVTSATVITDRDSGRSKGFGFVEMATDQEATAAITALNGKMVDEREIRVDKAKPQVDRDRRQNRGGPRRW